MKYNFDEEVNRKGTNSVKWDNLKNIFGRDDIIPLWVADTDFKAPIEVIEGIKKRADHGVFGYTFRGSSYNESVKNWLKRRHQWEIEREWITFSPGIVPALSTCVNTFTNPGDKVIIQSPIYPPFRSVVEGNGRKIIDNELAFKNNRYCMDLENLKRQIFKSNGEFDYKVKMLILCSPHNPTGRVWEKNELLELGKICYENNIIIVSDEIHSDIVYKNHKHIPIASLSEELKNSTITCISPSKSFSLAGLASSAIIIPNKKLLNLFNASLDTAHIAGGNIFGNIALEEAYNNGDDYLDELILYLEDNLNYCIDYFNEKIPQIKPLRPESTYLVWLDCSKLGLEDKELMNFFINKAKVGVNPGSSFSKKYKDFVRLNIGCTKKTLKEALYRIEKAVKEVIR
ncbi:MAG: pyridoxal phosphate-dependent aminotransferase [Tissierellales bacterium]|nr:pyridoxal phosphate-dependent aminotransferase [Tissierellales bacterium]